MNVLMYWIDIYLFKERAGRLEQEVESLRTVLEMKTEELHVSRHTR